MKYNNFVIKIEKKEENNIRRGEIKMQMLKRKSGITLVALIITIDMQVT